RAMRRVLLGESTAGESLRAMQDEINADIRAQREAPRRSQFAGSVLFWLCGLFLIAACFQAWRRFRPGRVAG
ncbi:MAG TPA: hypothetical protein VMF59_13000, partial [Bacteroidota bacterium]|nr:hypothetical protein [Bacteroidota bacterium]